MKKSIERYLRDSGWYEERNIDITEYVKVLESEGYEVNELILDFLREYGGLVVKHPHTRVEDSIDSFHFIVKRAVDSYFFETVEEYMDQVGEKLVVVGECRTDHMVLMLSHSGKMYAGYDDLLLKFGDTVEDALVALCEGTGITGVE